MDVKIGEVVVFAGRRDGKALDDHFTYFRIGKRYEISDIISVQYDIDEVTRLGGQCVLFKGESHGCHLESIGDYFVHQAEWRDSLLSKILPNYIMKIIKKQK